MRFKSFFLTLTAAFVIPLVTSAQVDEGEKIVDDIQDKGWHVGIQGGILAGESDFSSFASDRFRPGWNTGVIGGYRFNPVLSLDAYAQWGQAFLAEQSCCAERNYWLYTEEWRRSVFQLGHGAYFNNILSSNFIQRYGLQMNVNLLGFGNPGRHRRLSLDLSPSISVTGSSTDLILKDSDQHLYDNINKWHIGIGPQVQVGYRISDNIDLAVYSGFTYLTGKNFDAMPELHSNNYLYDAGIRLTFNFRKSKKNPAVISHATTVVPTPAVETKPIVEIKNDFVSDTVSTEPLVEPEPVPETDHQEKTEPIVEEVEIVIQDTAESVLNEELAENTIYFSFNSIWIEPSERNKVKEIARILKANPDVRVLITGWGCSIGTEEQNLRVSLQRAEGVKRVLGQWLVPAERIETTGAGIKHDAPTKELARCAATIEIIE